MAYILECRHIDKTYQTGKMEVPVLYDVNFTMEEGEYVAVMGPSGSGKSTLMNIIGCLDRLTEGELILDGETVSSLSEKELAEFRLKKVGFVFQTFQLLPGETALGNVELPLTYAKVPRKNRRDIALEALERVGLSDRVDFKPSQLSGGQKQRVAIARALVNRPKILLADEPTGALDSKSGRQVMELFRSLNEEGMSVLMITHDREIASYADRIVEIRDGRLLNAPGVPIPPRPEPEETDKNARAASAAASASAKTGGLQAIMDDGFFDDVDEETSDELEGGFFENVEGPEEEERPAGGLDDAEIFAEAARERPMSDGSAGPAAEAAAATGTETAGSVTEPARSVTEPADAEKEPDGEVAFAGEPDGGLAEGIVTRLTDADLDGEEAFAEEKIREDVGEVPLNVPESEISDMAAVEILHLAAEEDE